MNEYVAVFNYDGDITMLPTITKDLFERCFVELRNEIVDITNKKLEDWNNEFHRTCPDNNGMTAEYANFLISKFKPFVNDANTKHNLSESRGIWLDYELIDKEDNYGDFVMKMKLGYGKPVRCYITLRVR